MPDRERSLHILEALADGVDPLSGEVFPPDNTSAARSYPALCFAVNELKAVAEDGNKGKPWAS